MKHCHKFLLRLIGEAFIELNQEGNALLQLVNGAESDIYYCPLFGCCPLK